MDVHYFYARHFGIQKQKATFKTAFYAISSIFPLLIIITVTTC